MKEPRFVQDYLRDILEAMDKAEEFTNGLDLSTFTGDDETFALVGYGSVISLWRTQ